MSTYVSVDADISENQWWKDLFCLFANPGDYFEIHCWLDEYTELAIAEGFGEKACYSMPEMKIIHGTVTERLISYLVNIAKPEDCQCYNKMIPFFTIRIGDCFSSEKYGTEILMKSRNTKELEQIKIITNQFGKSVKIYTDSNQQDKWRIL